MGGIFSGDPTDDVMGLQGAYNPPAVFTPGQWALVATLPAVPDSNGFDVLIYEARIPARAFRLVAQPMCTREGYARAGWSLNTGTDPRMGPLIGQLAWAVTHGMLGPLES